MFLMWHTAVFSWPNGKMMNLKFLLLPWVQFWNFFVNQGLKTSLIYRSTFLITFGGGFINGKGPLPDNAPILITCSKNFFFPTYPLKWYIFSSTHVANWPYSVLIMYPEECFIDYGNNFKFSFSYMVFIQVSSDIFDFGCGWLLRTVLSFDFFLIFLKSFLMTLGIVVGLDLSGLVMLWTLLRFSGLVRAKTLFFSFFVHFANGRFLGGTTSARLLNCLVISSPCLVL